MKAYTLKRDAETAELHLFVGELKEDGKCTSGILSICQKMTKEESEGNVFTCLGEDAARIKCPQIGRPVCGVCVSDLHATLN